MAHLATRPLYNTIASPSEHGFTLADIKLIVDETSQQIKRQVYAEINCLERMFQQLAQAALELEEIVKPTEKIYELSLEKASTTPSSNLIENNCEVTTTKNERIN